MNTKGKPENLKPWKPGETGNSGGRPKKRPITDRYHANLEAPLEENIRIALSLPEGATNGDAVAKAQIRAAIKGKTYAARELREILSNFRAVESRLHVGVAPQPHDQRFGRRTLSQSPSLDLSAPRSR